MLVENVGLILYRGTICGLTEKTPFLYRYFEVLGQKISCQLSVPLNNIIPENVHWIGISEIKCIYWRYLSGADTEIRLGGCEIFFRTKHFLKRNNILAPPPWRIPNPPEHSLTYFRSFLSSLHIHSLIFVHFLADFTFLLFLLSRIFEI